ncbi:XdhC family protein [Oceanicella actignis]|uniref:XdhC family protein n=1 Tax=Oceanicella actignis TaxID=1189325 RepID=UPI0011E83E95|nr:XdhC family protein [Oceanicella actignis]TYO90909.1 xanthine dehydrogenase accessory factor [Oceanicella actignis]
MPRQDIFDEIMALRRKGAPFCVATVLRTADATSAKAGAKAAVTAEGAIIGHLGGACVQRAVRAAAAEALERGAPRVIRVNPSDKVVGLADPDGVQTFKSGCPSGGTVDILIEPWRLPPRLIVFGDGPIAAALREHAALAGLRALGGEAIGEAEAGDFVVVATQGAGDGDALRAALESPAAHVSMVASRRKARALCDKLAAAGMERARLERLKSPAGLDIGAVDPHEIAVSILAEVIAWRNAAGKAAARGERTA